jgi:KDO2-lipid IV(A) lauroyltransferase
MLGRMLGWTACYLGKKYRLAVEKNLKHAFKDYSLSKIRRVRDESYMNMGMNVVEFGLLSFRSRKFWLDKIEIIGRDIMEDNVKNKRGSVYITAHIGNWELMGAYLSMIGLPINVIAREIYIKSLDRILVSLRGRRGVNTIPRVGRANTKNMISAIRKGEVLGILIDQDTKVGGVFVDFFGRPAYTPTAISQFSRIKNADVVSGFVYRKKDLKHQIVIRRHNKGGIDEVAETREYTKIMEDFIKEHPAQWVWMHPRWKRKPQLSA